MLIDLSSLVMILAVGLVFGRPLAWVLRIGAAERTIHGIVARFGRKLTKAKRPVATRAARGFVVPCLLILLAALVGAAIAVLPAWLERALGMPASIATIPSYAILATMLSPQRYLWPLWQAVGHAAHARWGQLDAPLQNIAGGPMHAPDGHGRARLMVELSAQHFLHQFIGSIAALLVAGPVGLCIYRVVQLAALHYDGQILPFRGFHWASEKLGQLFGIAAYIIALPLLLVAGQLLPAVQPIRGMWRMLRRGNGHINLVAFIAHSTGLTLGGPAQWYGQSRTPVWLGNGTAKLMGHDLSSIFWWLLVSSALAILLLGAMAANFQATDFQHLFDLVPKAFQPFLS